MRWVFWILVLCNVGLAGWHFLGSGQNASPEPTAAASASNVAGAKRLQLWSELSADEKAVLAGGATGGGDTAAEEARGGPGESAAASNAGPVCGLVGPFADEITAKQVIQRLRAVDVDPVIYMLSLSTGNDYWVHLGPFDTRHKALEMLKSVQKAGVDSYLITDGPLANAVSLGLFSKREAAERLLARRSKQGWKAQITALPHKVRQRWLVFKASDAAGVGTDFWEGLAGDFAGVVHKETYCSDIASADEVE